jgi:predicted acylesterase/phospholipase RssA
MQESQNRPTLGLALGGSGSRTTFYIGFFEVLDQAGITVDFISASSGASIVASAYACGTLPKLKELSNSLNNESVKQYINKGKRGGLYCLDGMEEKMREFTGGKNFEEVKPHMSFVSVDIESGQQVNLCMGDIAKACRVSCTLPGVFEPVKWGSRTLVDGGLLNLVPINALKEFPVDVTVAIDIPGTKFIFSGRQITARKFFNALKKMLFIDEIEHLLTVIFGPEAVDLEAAPGFFTVLGKSMDLAIKANKNEIPQDFLCDLLINPKIPKLKPTMFIQFNPYYEMGRKSAEENLPKIKELIKQKQK